MPEGQKEIYFLHGPNRAALSTSPYLEALAKKGYEVLLLTDPVDEFAIAGIQQWKEKDLVSATRAELDLGETDDEKKAREATQTKLEDLLARAMKALDGRVSEVRLSDRLTESPSCLVIAKGGTPLAVEAMLRAAGRPVPENPRIFELNGGHPLVEKLAARLEAQPDDDTIVEYIEVLYEQAKLAEGGAPDDPGLFARRVAKLLALGL
jgi:molecular chaperone HtpG